MESHSRWSCFSWVTMLLPDFQGGYVAGQAKALQGADLLGSLHCKGPRLATDPSQLVFGAFTITTRYSDRFPSSIFMVFKFPARINHVPLLRLLAYLFPCLA